MTVDYRAGRGRSLAESAAGGIRRRDLPGNARARAGPGGHRRGARPPRAARRPRVFSTINRNVKSFALAIVGAEYLMRLLPSGTHEYERLIRPSELSRWARAAGLEVADLAGLEYDPFIAARRA